MVTHGYGAYSGGCRCAVCTEAKRDREARNRARRLAGIHHSRRLTEYERGIPLAPEWLTRALCAGHRPPELAEVLPEGLPPPDAWFGPTRHAMRRTARTWCRPCPVARDCYRYGRAIEAPVGVWGGQIFGVDHAT